MTLKKRRWHLMTTFKDLQHGTVNPFQPNTKAISYSVDKTLEQGVHKIDLITNGTTLYRSGGK